jgi:hypothetical protein
VLAVHVSLISLALPIAVTGVVLFFASFVSWMVLKLHWKDWRKMPDEDAMLALMKTQALTPGGYMAPGVVHPSDMDAEEFQRKIKDNPKVILTVLPETNMAINLLGTLIYFIVIAYLLAYLGSQAFKPGESFLIIFQFMFTASLPMFLGAMVSYSIWFRNRVTGYVVESIAYAAITAGIFGAMWPT